MPFVQRPWKLQRKLVRRGFDRQAELLGTAFAEHETALAFISGKNRIATWAQYSHGELLSFQIDSTPSFMSSTWGISEYLCMIYRIFGGIAFILIGLAALGLVLPTVVLGIVAIVAGGALLASQ